MGKGKSILFITCDSSLFGANKSLINIIASIKDELDSFYVITPYIGEFNKVLDELNIPNKAIRFNTDCGSIPKGFVASVMFILKYLKFRIINFRAEKQLLSFLKENDFNLIHTNSGVVSIGLRVAKELNIKHVWHLREFIDMDHGLEPFLGFNRYIQEMNTSDYIICISKSIFNRFQTLSLKTSILHDAVISKKEVLSRVALKLITTDIPYFLFCGSFTHNKGIEEALQAFSSFKTQNPHSDIRLKLAGSVSSNLSYFEKIKHLIDVLNLNTSVDLLGYVNDINPLMSNALALLVCSKNEALGRVTVEAMANSCIVIGYNNAGTSELIENNTTGFLYQTTEELVEKMNLVFHDLGKFNYMRNAALDFAIREFSEETFKFKLLEIYSKTLDN
jgi:glycosyltransferase involved in cell wall biosynthesis